ncbi:MAG: hypothetical protein QW728_06265 [Thermoplasmata archaeon]
MEKNTLEGIFTPHSIIKHRLTAFIILVVLLLCYACSSIPVPESTAYPTPSQGQKEKMQEGCSCHGEYTENISAIFRLPPEGKVVVGEIGIVYVLLSGGVSEYHYPPQSIEARWGYFAKIMEANGKVPSPHGTIFNPVHEEPLTTGKIRLELIINRTGLYMLSIYIVSADGNSSQTGDCWAYHSVHIECVASRVSRVALIVGALFCLCAAALVAWNIIYFRKRKSHKGLTEQKTR